MSDSHKAQQSSEEARALLRELSDKFAGSLRGIFEDLLAELDQVMLIAEITISDGSVDEDRFVEEVERVVATLHSADAAMVNEGMEQARHALSITEMRMSRLRKMVEPD